jgi:flagellar basal-body rod protein FlgB
MNRLFNKTINSLADMVGVRARKHRVILSNVSNIDTPGFKPSELTFANALDSAKNIRITQTNPGHLNEFDSAKNVRITRTNPGHMGDTGDQDSLRYDITESDEQVKLDTEMASLSENHLMYNATVEILARKFKGIRATLSETK